MGTPDLKVLCLTKNIFPSMLYFCVTFEASCCPIYNRKIRSKSKKCDGGINVQKKILEVSQYSLLLKKLTFCRKNTNSELLNVNIFPIFILMLLHYLVWNNKNKNKNKSIIGESYIWDNCPNHISLLSCIKKPILIPDKSDESKNTWNNEIYKFTK